MTHLYLIRHGETAFNVQEQICGRTDVALNENGIKQAAEAGRFFINNKIKLDILLCSTLRRAVQTAEIINQSLQLPIVYLPDLQEVDCGDYEGRRIPEVKKETFDPPYQCGSVIIHDGAELRSFFRSTDPRYDAVAHPNGESKEHARKRFMKAIDDYLTAHPEHKNVGIVAHGAVIRLMMAVVAPADFGGTVTNGEIFNLEYIPAPGGMLFSPNYRLKQK